MDEQQKKKIDQIYQWMQQISRLASHSSAQSDAESNPVTPAIPQTNQGSFSAAPSSAPAQSQSSNIPSADAAALQQSAKDFNTGLTSIRDVFTTMSANIANLQTSITHLTTTMGNHAQGQNVHAPTVGGNVAAGGGRPGAANATNTHTATQTRTPQAQFQPVGQGGQQGRVQNLQQNMQQNNAAQVPNVITQRRSPQGGLPAALATLGGAPAASGGGSSGIDTILAGLGPLGKIASVLDKFTGFAGAVSTYANAIPGPQKAMQAVASAIPATIQESPEFAAYGRRMGAGSNSEQAYRDVRQSLVQQGMSTSDQLNYGGQIQRQERQFGTPDSLKTQNENQLNVVGGMSRAYGWDKQTTTDQVVQQRSADIDVNKLAGAMALAMQRSGAANGSSVQFAADFSKMVSQQQQTSVTGASQNQGAFLAFNEAAYKSGDQAQIQGALSAQGNANQAATHTGNSLHDLLFAQATSQGMDITQASIYAQKATPQQQEEALTKVSGGAANPNRAFIEGIFTGNQNNTEAEIARENAVDNAKTPDPAQQARLTQLQGNFAPETATGAGLPELAKIAANDDTSKQAAYDLIQKSGGSAFLSGQKITSADQISDPTALVSQFGQSTGGKTDLNQTLGTLSDANQRGQSGIENAGEAAAIGDQERVWAAAMQEQISSMKALTPAVQTAGQALVDFSKGASGNGGKTDAQGNVTINSPMDIGVAARQWLHGKVPGFATGTNSAPPGLKWEGEGGAELVNSVGGEGILNHGESISASTKYASEDSMQKMLQVLTDILKATQKQDPQNIAFSTPQSFNYARQYTNPYNAQGFAGPVPNPGTVAGYGSSGGGGYAISTGPTGTSSAVGVSGSSGSGSGTVSGPVNTDGLSDPTQGTPDGSQAPITDPTQAKAPSSASANSNLAGPPQAAGKGQLDQFRSMTKEQYTSIISKVNQGRPSDLLKDGQYESFIAGAQKANIDPYFALSAMQQETGFGTNPNAGAAATAANNNYIGMTVAKSPPSPYQRQSGGSSGKQADNNLSGASYNNVGDQVQDLARWAREMNPTAFDNGDIQGLYKGYATDSSAAGQKAAIYNQISPGKNTGSPSVPSVATAPVQTQDQGTSRVNAAAAPTQTQSTSTVPQSTAKKDTWQGAGGTYSYDPATGTLTEPDGTVRTATVDSGHLGGQTPNTTATTAGTGVTHNAVQTTVPVTNNTATVPTSAAAPTPQTIQGYLKNALSQKGTSAHGGTGYDSLNTGAVNWKNYCEAFVEATLQDAGLISRTGPSTGKFDTASDAQAAARQRGNLYSSAAANVPTGAIVYADYGGPNNSGHTGIATGNGQYISGGINDNIEVRDMATDLGRSSGGNVQWTLPPGYHYDVTTHAIVPDDPTKATTPPITPARAPSAAPATSTTTGATTTTTTPAGGATPTGTSAPSSAATTPTTPDDPATKLQTNIASYKQENDRLAAIANDDTETEQAKQEARDKIKANEKQIGIWQDVYGKNFGGPTTLQGGQDRRDATGASSNSPNITDPNHGQGSAFGKSAGEYNNDLYQRNLQIAWMRKQGIDEKGNAITSGQDASLQKEWEQNQKTMALTSGPSQVVNGAINGEPIQSQYASPAAAAATYTPPSDSAVSTVNKWLTFPTDFRTNDEKQSEYASSTVAAQNPFTTNIPFDVRQKYNALIKSGTPSDLAAAQQLISGFNTDSQAGTKAAIGETRQFGTTNGPLPDMGKGDTIDNILGGNGTAPSPVVPKNPITAFKPLQGGPTGNTTLDPNVGIVNPINKTPDTSGGDIIDNVLGGAGTSPRPNAPADPNNRGITSLLPILSDHMGPDSPIIRALNDLRQTIVDSNNNNPTLPPPPLTNNPALTVLGAGSKPQPGIRTEAANVWNAPHPAQQKAYTPTGYVDDGRFTQATAPVPTAPTGVADNAQAGSGGQNFAPGGMR